MMPLVLVLLLIGQNPTATVTTRSTKEARADTAGRMFVEADPDVVVRGRSATIVVRGRDLESLKTLQISPAEGVRLGVVTPLSPRPDGSAAVSVEVSVEPTAHPGGRALTLAVAPTIETTSATRPGSDPQTKPMDALFDAVVKTGTKAVEFSTLYVNSHDVTIIGASVEAGRPRRIRITATDAAGDLDLREGGGPIEITGSTSTSALVPEPVISEARCGRDVFDGVVTGGSAQKQGSSVVIVADLEMPPLDRLGACELRVRLQDNAGNTSLWFKTTIGAR